MKRDIIFYSSILFILFSFAFLIGVVIKMNNEIIYLTDSNKEKLEIIIQKNEEIDMLKDQLDSIPK